MKNINKSFKKKLAFTVVELVIVIAIIAILAAVLIPTFSGLIRTSQMSSDQQLAKNMNTALAIAEVEDGKNPTFSDAIADILKAGYTVDKLTPTAEGCQLVWDQDSDRMLFLDADNSVIYAEGEKNAKVYHMWKVAHKAEDIKDGYSFYLADDFTDTLPAIITTGIDVGTRTISAIEYERTSGDPQDVIIRTNGGTLTVNAPNDTVHHYGTTDSVIITAVANASYEEYGEVVGFIFLTKGHVKIINTEDANSSSSGIVVLGTDVIISVKNRTPIVYSNILTSDQIAGLQSNITALVNITDITYSVQDLQETNSGLGTQESPYIIRTIEEFSSLNNEDKYYKLQSDITVDIKDFTENAFISGFKGTLLGNGKKITVTNTTGKTMSSGSVYRIFNNVEGELQNFVIINKTGNLVSIVNGQNDAGETKYSLTFRDIDYGYEGIQQSIKMETKNCGLFTQSGVDNISFYNCNNYYDIESTCTGYLGIFVGGRVSSKKSGEVKLHFENCANYGDVFADGNFGVLIGNYNGNRNPSNTTVINCYNYGTMNAVATCRFMGCDGSIDNIDGQFTGAVNSGSFNEIGKNKIELKSAASVESILYINPKETTDIVKYVLNYHEQIVLKNSSDETVGTFGISIQVEVNASDLTNTDGKLYTGYAVGKYQTYKEYGQSYAGTWATTNKGIKYFYDSGNSQFVFDFDKYFTDNIKTEAITDYSGVGGQAIKSAVGYNANGDAVAFATFEFEQS